MSSIKWTLASVTFCVSIPKHSFLLEVVIIALLQPQNGITDCFWRSDLAFQKSQGSLICKLTPDTSILAYALFRGVTSASPIIIAQRESQTQTDGFSPKINIPQRATPRTRCIVPTILIIKLIFIFTSFQIQVNLTIIPQTRNPTNVGLDN